MKEPSSAESIGGRRLRADMISSLSDRLHYNSLENCTYLNQASLGLIGEPAVRAMHEFLDTIGRHGNVHMTDAEEVAFHSELRKPAAQLFRCEPGRLAILASASEMLSQLPWLLRPPAGSHVLAISSDFPAVTRPWMAYGAEHDCPLNFVDEASTDDLTDGIIQAIDERTAVIVVSHVQFSTGTLVDVERIREVSRRFGATLVVDVTQSAGAIPIDTTSWDADVVVCSGYKWLGGHGGVGLAVMTPTLLDRPPPMIGWMSAPDPFDFRATELPLADDARRYTQSTMSYISLRGLTVAISELLGLGLSEIDAHARSLRDVLLERLDGTGWAPVGFGGPGLIAAHIVALVHDGGAVDVAMHALREETIMCSSRNNRLRVSLAHFNDERDVLALTRVLEGIDVP